MLGKKKVDLPKWMAFERMRPALVVGLALFAVSDVLDWVLSWMNLPAAATILDNVAVAILGGLLALFYMSASYESHNFARAKERMRLVAELNTRIRDALAVIETSALLEDRSERLQRIEEATSRIDHVLTDVVPTFGNSPKENVPPELSFSHSEHS